MALDLLEPVAREKGSSGFREQHDAGDVPTRGLRERARQESLAQAAALLLGGNGQRAQQRRGSVNFERNTADDLVAVRGDPDGLPVVVEAREREAAGREQSPHGSSIAVARHAHDSA